MGALVGQVMLFVVRDVLFSIVYFPVWWYTQGTWRILKAIGVQVSSMARVLHLPTLFKYLLKPMYGYTDIISRIISFYVRIVQFVILLTIAIVIVVLLLLGFVAWILLPPFVVYNLLFQLQLIDFNLYQL